MAELDEARQRVYQARQQRVPPLLDDKVLVSWNALLIGALAEAARVLDVPRYRVAAERAVADLYARFVRPDGGLYRTARAGRVHLDAYLEDYAYLGVALIDLYESGASRAQLDRALVLCERMLRDFGDDDGGFFHTAHQHEALIARSRDGQDDALPNASAIAAELCARLSYHFARDDLRRGAERTVERSGAALTRAPRAFASMLSVVDLLTAGPVEVALIGAADDPRTSALARAVAQVFLPNRILAHGDGRTPSPDAPTDLPLLAGKTAPKGDPTVYICREFACEAPLKEPSLLISALKARRSG